MKPRLFLQIVLLCIGFSIAYGLIHDQITIRICPEYFTIWHPNPLGIQDLTLLALYWGVVATWWMGLFLGIIIAAVTTMGPEPVPPLPVVCKYLASMLVANGVFASGVGLWSHLAGLSAQRAAGPEIASMGQEKVHSFTVDLATHSASYLSGVLGAGVVCILLFVWRRRHLQMASPK